VTVTVSDNKHKITFKLEFGSSKQKFQNRIHLTQQLSNLCYLTNERLKGIFAKRRAASK